MLTNSGKKIIASVLIAGCLFLFVFYMYVLPIENAYYPHSKYSVGEKKDIESNSGSSFLVNNLNMWFFGESYFMHPVHIFTPNSVKSIYMTSWVAGTAPLRDHVIGIAETTEVNSVVIDLKDYSGRIAYPVLDHGLKEVGSSYARIPNLSNLTSLMHSKGIYVIGRVACFQDPYFAQLHPEYAVKTKDNPALIWQDKHGLLWLDPGEKPVWDYLIAISRDAYEQGVDEIQFDYTRFPSDGDMKNIYYPASNEKKKSEVIKEFWEYLSANLRGTGPVTSVDLFGLTASVNNDVGIGQLFENALENFDYVSPMVYPSHFAPYWHGFKDPQSHPYEVVKISMDSAVQKADALGVPRFKIRPWLQDFGLYGETYGPKELRSQIQATYDAGLTSWIMWDPTNQFHIDGFIQKSF